MDGMTVQKQALFSHVKAVNPFIGLAAFLLILSSVHILNGLITMSLQYNGYFNYAFNTYQFSLDLFFKTQ